MSFFERFLQKPKTACVARDRLTLVLAHERSVKIPYMEDMKNEIIAVVKKYTNTDRISIRADSNQQINTLEVEIILD